MKQRYSKSSKEAKLVDEFIRRSINVLSFMYGRIYFPTYSNGLKDVAQYLGFKWSSDSPSGLNALLWRSKWEQYKSPEAKQKLITYNSEDCEAVEVVS